ncbi:OPT/YSL family transporter [Nonomuraea sp. NPDC048892]|uniref:OPT/YSL family transporter n=1 Tax=Nonomuraea sp. NPDC048892 TaxID=3154624 RepID=UPI0033C251EB
MPSGPSEEHPPPPRHLTLAPIALGVLLGGCLSVLNVILAFKAGTGSGGAIITVLLGGAALRLLRKLNWRTLFVTYATASGGTLAVSAIDTSIGAGLLSGDPMPSWISLAGLALLANLLGLVLGVVLAPTIIGDPGLKYPALWPVIDLMHTLTGSGDREAGAERQRLIVVAAVVAAVLSFAAALAGRDSLPPAPGLPPYLALSLSPMLFGLGLRLPGASTVWIGLGAAYSLVVWYATALRTSPRPAPAYAEHLGSPWILAVGVGLLLGYACGFVVRLAAGPGRAVAGAMRGRGGHRWLAVAGISAVVAAFVALPPPYLTIAVALVVLAPLFAVILNRVNAATGMAPTGVLQFLALVVLALAHVPQGTAYLLVGLVCGSALASAYYIEAAKVASTARDAPRTRQLLACQAIGSVAGVGTGITVLFLIGELGAVGSAAFPAPTSSALDFLNALLRGSPEYAHSAVLFLVPAALAGLALAWTPVLPTLLGLGVLLPAATSAAILLGSLAKLVSQRRRRDEGAFAATVGSGLILGGGLANALLLPIQLITS